MAASSARNNQPATGISERIKQSFLASAGDIIFGMEDGTVSIFGLVFGVAASAAASHQVLLAGATGAVAAAVSMMAGVFLDVESARGQARAALAHEQQEVEEKPAEERAEVLGRLQKTGFSDNDAAQILEIVERTPGALLGFEVAFELKSGTAANENPLVHALWMLLADLFAATIPVLPFAFFSLDSARIVSLILTTILLVVLGVGRSRIGHTPVLWTVLETLGIAALAAGAGILIGILLGSTGGLARREC